MTFADYFQRATGHEPYPYQVTLAQADLTRRALAAPTGAGKTAAAVLAWLWQRHTRPASTPLRLIWCLPGRTLLDPIRDAIQVWLGNLDLQDTVGLHTIEGGYEDKEWELRPEQPAELKFEDVEQGEEIADAEMGLTYVAEYPITVWETTVRVTPQVQLEPEERKVFVLGFAPPSSPLPKVRFDSSSRWTMEVDFSLDAPRPGKAKPYRAQCRQDVTTEIEGVS